MTGIVMPAVCYTTSGLGPRKFQALHFCCTVYMKLFQRLLNGVQQPNAEGSI
jgi:hypothetical protein